MSIYKKLNEVMEKVSYVTKDANVGFGKNQYKAATRDAVVAAVRQHFVEKGIVVITSQVEKGISVDGNYSSGGAKIRFEGLYDVSFIDIDDESKVTLRLEGHGEDSSDKAPGKAATYAEKAAIIKALLLETGEENEETKNTINLKQVQLIQKLIESTNTDVKDFLAFYGVDKISDMPESSFTHGMTALQNKQKKQGAKSE